MESIAFDIDTEDNSNNKNTPGANVGKENDSLASHVANASKPFSSERQLSNTRKREIANEARH